MMRDDFAALIDYEFFDVFLENSLMQTLQMEERNLFAGKWFDGADETFLADHNTSFLDVEFNEKFTDPDEPPRPIDIKFLDFGWILRRKAGQEFLRKLAYSERLEYFDTESVKYMITYQWRKLSPIIISRLFYPFVIYFVILHAWVFVVNEKAK